MNSLSRAFGKDALDKRGIPVVWDGLKEVQRIALYLMASRAGNVSTLNLIGDMTGTFYVHGDASAEEAVSRLAAPWLNNVPLLQGEGAFGTRLAPDAFSAARYTQIKRTRLAETVLYADMHLTPTVANYSGTLTMPAFFVPLLPLVLLNGINGVGVGWSTKILPRSLESLVQAVHDVLDGKNPKNLTPCYSNYDITLKHIGDSQYQLVGKLHREGSYHVHVTELPPEKKHEKFIEHLNDLMALPDDHPYQVKDFIDRTTNTFNIEIKFNREKLAALSDDDLIDMFKLSTTVTERIVTMGWDLDSVIWWDSAEELITEWVKKRLMFHQERYVKLLEEQQERLLYYYAILSCFQGAKGIPPIPASLRSYQTRSDLIAGITRILDANDITLSSELKDKIASLPSYKWTEEGFAEVEAVIRETLVLIEDYEDIINRPKRIREIYKSELKALKKLV